MFPVRCFTCGYCVGKHEAKYEEMLESGMTSKEIFEKLKIERYCCRRMFLAYVNVVDNLLQYSQDQD